MALLQNVRCIVNDDYTIDVMEDPEADLSGLSTEIYDQDFKLHEEVDIKVEEPSYNENDYQQFTIQDFMTIKNEPAEEPACIKNNDPEPIPAYHYVFCPKCNHTIGNYKHQNLLKTPTDECQECSAMIDCSYWSIRRHFLNVHPELIEAANRSDVCRPQNLHCDFCRFQSRFTSLLKMHLLSEKCSKCKFVGRCVSTSKHVCSEVLSALNEIKTHHNYASSFTNDTGDLIEELADTNVTCRKMKGSKPKLVTLIDTESENRFKNIELDIIQQNVEKINNKSKTKESIWNQFEYFLEKRRYVLSKEKTKEDLEIILMDWATNMRKFFGEDYKALVIKTMWSSTAKTLQEYYQNKFNRTIDPFSDQQFKKARDARRRQLQAVAATRKRFSVAATEAGIIHFFKLWPEDTPVGLQRKFFHIAAYELAWRAPEATYCRTCYFQPEKDGNGVETGRVEYNPPQGENKSLYVSKWLNPNPAKPKICPARLFKLLMSRRPDSITTDRMFITPNNKWIHTGIWYKDCPIGKNRIRRWLKQAADEIGIDVKHLNASNRRLWSTATVN